MLGKKYNREEARSEAEAKELDLQVRRVRKELTMETLDKNLRDVSIPPDAAK